MAANEPVEPIKTDPEMSRFWAEMADHMDRLREEYYRRLSVPAHLLEGPISYGEVQNIGGEAGP